MMRYLITLYLEPPDNNLDYVKQLQGLKGLEIDNAYGLVLISPKRNLYTIRASGDVEPESLMSMHAEIKGIYPDTRISTVKQPKEED